MTRRCVSAWLGVLLVPGLLGVVPRLPAQTLVATAHSAGRLADDLEYLAKALAPAGDESLQAGLRALKQFKDGELVRGLDRTRLIGVAVTLPQDPGGAPMVVAAVPVTNYAQFLDSLKDLGITVDADSGVPGFSHRVTTPDGAQTLFALEARKYAFFSLIPSRADSISKLDPASWRPKGGAEGDLSLALNLSQLPDAVRDQFINGLEASMAETEARRPDEPEAEYKGRMAGAKVSAEAVKLLIREGEAVELALTVDPSREEIVLDLTASARMGTSLAKTLAAFSERKSRFPWIEAGSPLSGWVSLPIPKQMGDALAETLETERKESESKAKDDAAKALNQRVYDLLKQAVTGGDLDMGLAVQGPVKNAAGQSRYTIITGMKVPSGKDAERLIRDAAAQIPPEKRESLKLDAAKARDGTPIHQFVTPESTLDPKLVKQFGATGFFLAFPGDTALLTFGDEGEKAIRQAIDNLAKPAVGRGDPASFQTHVSSLGQLADQDPEAVRQAAAEIFQGARASRDRITLSLKGEGPRLRLKLTVDVPALKFAVKIGRKDEDR